MHLHDPAGRNISRRDRQTCRDERSEKPNEDFHAEKIRTAERRPQESL
jgi:hypothetical protein